MWCRRPAGRYAGTLPAGFLASACRQGAILGTIADAVVLKAYLRRLLTRRGIAIRQALFSVAGV
jgi:hypothetical protein